MLEKDSLHLLPLALEQLDNGFGTLPPAGYPDLDLNALREILLAVAERLQDNFPYFHPLYAGQMLKPPHPIARLAYALAQWINPNNHALDGGRASSNMEKEAVAHLAAMLGWETHLGHLTGGGTMANLEALWVASQLKPDGVTLASSQAHYTHSRISAVLQIPFEAVPCDRRGRMDLHALEERLQAGNVATVVATIGATATGAVDPLPEILELRQRYSFRIHADAAYGGYFLLLDDLAPDTWRAYHHLSETDSIVIDPHKHGLQPYGCGCVIFRDPSVGCFYKHDSPYTYFSSSELHLGEISLECSRPGAAAVGLWATQRLLPLVKDGAFARDLRQCRQAALALFEKIQADARFITAFPPELDILLWAIRADSVSQASIMARQLFSESARLGLHLALAELPIEFFSLPADMNADRSTITCLRSVLMKPEHLAWIERIWAIIQQATSTVFAVQSKG